MKRGKSRGNLRNGGARAAATSPPAAPAKAVRWPAIIATSGLLLGLMIAGAWWLGHRSPVVPLPAVDLSAVDSKVAATLRQHQEEARKNAAAADKGKLLEGGKKTGRGRR